MEVFHKVSSVQKLQYLLQLLALHSTLLGIACINEYGPVNEELSILDDDFIVVESIDFPIKCCTEKNWKIVYTGLQYMRLEFTDIDIPIGSAILLLDSHDELTPDQPRLVDKTYVRKGFVFNGSSIKIIFKPIHSALSTYYAGFRAEISTTNDLPSEWEFWPTSEGCQPVNDVMNGGVLQLQDRPSIYRMGIRSLPSMPMHDCIWLFKMHPEFRGSGFNVRLFLRIDELVIDKNLKSHFELRVYEDNSQGDFLDFLNADTPEIKNGSAPIVITSNRNLYVRLKLPYATKTGIDEERYLLRITYGIYTETTSDTHECSFAHLAGFNCMTPQWCVPITYMCDGIVNCASYEDEISTTCSGPVMPVSTTSQPLAEKPTTIHTRKIPDTSNEIKDPDEASFASCYNLGLYYCFLNKKCLESEKYLHKCTNEKITSDASSSRSSSNKCGYWQRECDDGHCVGQFETCFTQSCGSYEKKCEDGSCVDTWNDCLNPCQTWETICEDGTCKDFTDRCPEDSCESYKPLKCDDGNTCAYDIDRCDNTCQCNDCSDEDGCDARRDGKNLIVLVVILAVVLTSTCIFLYMLRSCNKPSHTKDVWSSLKVVGIAILLVLVVSGMVCLKKKFYRKRGSQLRFLGFAAFSICICGAIGCLRRRKKSEKSFLQFLGFSVLGFLSCIAYPFIAKRRKRQAGRSTQGDTEDPVTHPTTYCSGTAMQPVITGSHHSPRGLGTTARSPYVSYTPVPVMTGSPALAVHPHNNAFQSNGYGDVPPLSSAQGPPSYGEALNTNNYPPPPHTQQEEMAPPPSYDSIVPSAPPAPV